MAIIIGTPQSDINITIRVPQDGDAIRAPRLNSIFQTLLNNDAIIDSKIDNLIIPANSITSTELGPNSVGAINIQNRSITGDKIVDGTIENSKFADGTIDLTRLKFTNTSRPGQHVTAGPNNDFTWVNAPIISVTNGSIGLSRLNATNSPIEGQFVIAASSDKFTYVDTPLPQIPANSIRDIHLAPNCVSTSKLKTRAVTRAKLAPKSVGIDEFAAGRFIGARKIKNNSIGTKQFEWDALLPASKFTLGSFRGEHFEPNSISTHHLNSINVATAGDLATATANSDDFRWVAPPTLNIADNSIGESKLHLGLTNAMGLTSPSPPPTAGQLLTLDNAAYQTWLWVDKGTGAGDSLTRINWIPTATITSTPTGITSNITAAFALRKGNQVWFRTDIWLTGPDPWPVGVVARVAINLNVPYATTREQDIFCLSDPRTDGLTYGTIKNLASPTGWVMQVNTILTRPRKGLIISGMYVA